MLSIFLQHKISILFTEEAAFIRINAQPHFKFNLTDSGFNPLKPLDKGKTGNNIFANGLAKKLNNIITEEINDPKLLQKKKDIICFVPKSSNKKEVNHWLDFCQFIGGAKVFIVKADKVNSAEIDSLLSAKMEDNYVKNNWLGKVNLSNIIWPVQRINKALIT